MSPQLATILSASISGAVAIIVCIINNKAQLAKTILELRQILSDFKADTEKNRAVTDERINNLTDEVRKHNSLVERTYQLEAENKVQNEKLAELEKWLDKS